MGSPRLGRLVLEWPGGVKTWAPSFLPPPGSVDGGQGRRGGRCGRVPGTEKQGFSAHRRPAGCTSVFSAHSAGRLGGINPGVQHTVESTWQGVSPAHLEGEERH